MTKEPLRKADGTPLTLDDLPGGANNPHPTREVEVVVKLTVPATLSEAGEKVIVAKLERYADTMAGTQSAQVHYMKAIGINDLLFLWNEVRLTGDVMRTIDPGSVFGGMTCTEAQSLADVFAAAGDQETHDHIMESHAHGDDDPDDEHHDKYLEIQENGGSL